ncbi:TPA: hypothetical protein EYP44_02845 [Candidatus Bathyarchaeota archaeon]|nr:hypothetical protein [Candidatus Bathyarchaeota archaeon]
MPVWRRITFRRRHIRRHTNSGYVPRCSLCGKPFRVGDRAWSRYRGPRSVRRTVHYCLPCRERILGK